MTYDVAFCYFIPDKVSCLAGGPRHVWVFDEIPANCLVELAQVSVSECLLIT